MTKRSTKPLILGLLILFAVVSYCYIYNQFELLGLPPYDELIHVHSKDLPSLPRDVPAVLLTLPSKPEPSPSQSVLPSAPQHMRTTYDELGVKLIEIYDQLCRWNVTSPGGVKFLPQHLRDQLAVMYAPLIEAEPPVPLTGRRPGGRLTADTVDCSQASLELSSLLTGKRRPQGPRKVVDMPTGMGGGAELDLLELRLHELDGVADLVVVTESHFGNRCDHKLLHFNRSVNRFANFSHRIIYVVTEQCETYMKTASKCHAKPAHKRPKGIYFQEQGQRNCTLHRVQLMQPSIPDDALVIVTDLDEIPFGPVINALKHCEVKSQVRWPLRLQLQAIPFSLRTGCSPGRQRYNKGNVAEWRQVKKKKVGIWPLPGTDKIPRGGVHLTAYGGRHNLDYRFLHHGESGVLLATLTRSGERRGLCNIKTTSELQELQQFLNDCPICVIRAWERHNRDKKLELATSKSLAACDLPWPLVSSPSRYPFFWGRGSLLAPGK